MPITRYLRALYLLAACAALWISSAQAAAPEDVLLPVPQRSQVDGSVWGPSNCGPASLAMMLEAFGDKVPAVDLRKRANQLLGVSSPNTGTKIEHLAQIAREHGFTATDPLEGKNYRRWTLDQARAEIRAGHPVMVQVYFPYLPNQRRNPVVTDHFVVLVGTDGSGFIFNDPADTKAAGYRQRMTEAELTKAWGWSGAPYAAFAMGPGDSGKSLLPPPPPPPTPAVPEPPIALTATPSPVAEAQTELEATPSFAALVDAPEAETTLTEVAVAEPATPDHLPREVTGGEEINLPGRATGGLSVHFFPPAVLAILIGASQVRSTWGRRQRKR